MNKNIFLEQLKLNVYTKEELKEFKKGIEECLKKI